MIAIGLCMIVANEEEVKPKHFSFSTWLLHLHLAIYYERIGE
ncbi:hypothetical protein [Priestia megaterium]|nr:hypothetical protein [Priestia megaterium]